MTALLVLLAGPVLGLIAWIFWPALHPGERGWEPRFLDRAPLPEVGETVDVVIRGELWPFKVTRVEGRQIFGQSEPKGPKGYVVAFGEVPLHPSQFVRRIVR